MDDTNLYFSAFIHKWRTYGLVFRYMPSITKLPPPTTIPLCSPLHFLKEMQPFRTRNYVYNSITFRLPAVLAITTLASKNLWYKEYFLRSTRTIDASIQVMQKDQTGPAGMRLPLLFHAKIAFGISFCPHCKRNL